MWRHGSGKMHRSELFPRWKMNFENIDQILSFMYAHVKWWQTAETNFGKLVLHYRYFLLHYRTPLTCSNFIQVTIGEKPTWSPRRWIQVFPLRVQLQRERSTACARRVLSWRMRRGSNSAWPILIGCGECTDLDLNHHRRFTFRMYSF